VREPIVTWKERSVRGQETVVDGANRVLISAEEKLPRPPIRKESFASDDEAREECERLNYARRQLTVDQKRVKRTARIERVVEARQEGKSEREIAEDLGVSKTQVHRDLETAATGPGGPVETPDGKVTGQDGRQQPARKPRNLCDRCTKEYPGKGKPGCPACRDLNHKPKAAPKVKPPEDPEDVPFDSYGTPLPKRCRDAYVDPWIQEAVDFLGVASVQFWQMRLADGMRKREKRYPFIMAQDFIDGYGFAGNYIDQLLEHLKEFRPAGVCPACKGEGCGHCKMCGLVSRKVYESLKGAANGA
jgi:hypothetical protein